MQLSDSPFHLPGGSIGTYGNCPLRHSLYPASVPARYRGWDAFVTVSTSICWANNCVELATYWVSYNAVINQSDGKVGILPIRSAYCNAHILPRLEEACQQNWLRVAVETAKVRHAST